MCIVIRRQLRTELGQYRRHLVDVGQDLRYRLSVAEGELDRLLDHVGRHGNLPTLIVGEGQVAEWQDERTQVQQTMIDGRQRRRDVGIFAILFGRPRRSRQLLPHVGLPLNQNRQRRQQQPALLPPPRPVSRRELRGGVPAIVGVFVRDDAGGGCGCAHDAGVLDSQYPSPHGTAHALLVAGERPREGEHRPREVQPRDRVERFPRTRVLPRQHPLELLPDPLPANLRV